MALIEHARYTLENWMATLMTTDGGYVANLSEFLAVPLVTGEHFEEHLSALTFHLLTELYSFFISCYSPQ